MKTQRAFDINRTESIFIFFAQFRYGDATWAFRSRLPSELIQVHGDWQSDAYKIYLDFSYADKLSVSEAMAINLKS